MKNDQKHQKKYEFLFSVKLTKICEKKWIGMFWKFAGITSPTLNSNVGKFITSEIPENICRRLFLCKIGKNMDCY